MPSSRDSYSTFVVWTKVFLPVAGLFILSTMFLYSGRADVSSALPFTTADVKMLVSEQRISNPYFAGQTEKGEAILVTAAYAKPNPDSPNSFSAEKLHARIVKMTNHDKLSVKAQKGELSEALMVFEGDVRVTIEQNLFITTNKIHFDTQKLTIWTDEPLTIRGEFGHFSSNSMFADISGSAPIVDFQGGVKMIHQPMN